MRLAVFGASGTTEHRLVEQALVEQALAEGHAQVIKGSDLDWTIVRGPRLTEGPHLVDAFGLEVAKAYRVVGEPTSLPNAKALATSDPYQCRRRRAHQFSNGNSLRPTPLRSTCRRNGPSVRCQFVQCSLGGACPLYPIRDRAALCSLPASRGRGRGLVVTDRA